MSDVTKILCAIDRGDPRASSELLPLVYAELRALAEHRMRQERPGHTLQATVLVHEAYMRLIGPIGNGGGAVQPQWDGRRHFFAAAAEAMRRILVDHARSKGAMKRGGHAQRVTLDALAVATVAPEMVVDLDAALTRFAVEEPQKAELVKLRFFAGLTLPQAADTLGISRATAARYWTYARAWLFATLNGAEADDGADPTVESAKSDANRGSPTTESALTDSTPPDGAIGRASRRSDDDQTSR
ncbi:MAG TPA: sigma-70 family RNA polymerase sigma factor [Phycisphaerales bacterium]|nr:sigma-70 family RNA polymerase sigma factor [Phycisphaerales bacterium]HMP37789.1 sigma-70 family RNA polymerase sigma factor [Phycisphaerales bacterium]